MSKDATIGPKNQRQDGGDTLSISGALKLESGSTFQIQTQTLAAAGTSQGTAAALTPGYNKVTGADETKGAILPVPSTNPAGGDVVLIRNTVAHTLPVYPHLGGVINGGSSNAGVNISSSAGAIAVPVDANNWEVIIVSPT